MKIVKDLKLMYQNDVERRFRCHRYHRYYEAMDINDEERKLINDFYQAVDELEESQQTVMELALENKNDEAYTLYVKNVQQPRDDLIHALTVINSLKIDRVTEIINPNVENGKNTAKTLIIVVCFVDFNCKHNKKTAKKSDFNLTFWQSTFNF